MLVTEQSVYDLLSHLQDKTYLQGHPLAALASAEGPRRGGNLRQLLLDLIESLRPAPDIPTSDPAWRPYLALHLRYVELRSSVKVQEALGLSERQVRREQSRGIAALAMLLGEALSGSEAGEESQTLAQDALRQATQALRITPEALDVHAQLNEVAGLVTPRLARCGAALEIPAAQPVILYADRVTFRQVLVRLASALAAAQGPGAIQVDYHQRGKEVQITLRPTGAGAEPTPIPESTLQECNYLAELNLGRVWQDRPGGAVSCVFPAEPPLLMLVIDDEETATRMLRRYVQGLNVRVIGVTDPDDAVDLVGELQPDAITLDVLMPGRDGWEVLQRLKSMPETSEVPVIVCSVWNEPELALALGAADFIRKPVTRSRLLQALSRALPPEAAARFPVD